MLLLAWLQELIVDGIVNIKKESATRVFRAKVAAVEAVREPDQTGQYYTKAQEQAEVTLQTAKCNLLMNLDQTASLPFQLRDIFEDLSSHVPKASGQ